MRFTETGFLFFFLPVVFAVYFLFLRRRPRAGNAFLAAASFVFYAWGEPFFVFVMAFSVVVNYAFAFFMDPVSGKKRKLLHIAAVVFDVALLGALKYAAFFSKSLAALTGLALPVSDIPLPAGISFYTFQAISYVTDVYRGKEKAESGLINTALYISFFPQLIAGPIVRYSVIAEEIRRRGCSSRDVSDGIFLFIRGLGKKVLLADRLAVPADAAFRIAKSGKWIGAQTGMSAPMAWLGALAFGLQIYYDFSGYSDMAVGLGRMFGFHLPENFRNPLAAGSVSEFWRRWHITLGEWFRDYVYIPLGGSREGSAKRIRNLFLVWILTGLWHGAGWNFVLWGMVFFTAILLEKLPAMAGPGKNARKERKKGPALRAAGHLWTLLVFFTGMVFFRADSAGLAFRYLSSMFRFSTAGQDAFTFYGSQYGIFLAAGALFALPAPAAVRRFLQKDTPAVLLVKMFLAAVVFIFSAAFIVNVGYTPFIYFAF